MIHATTQIGTLDRFVFDRIGEKIIIRMFMKEYPGPSMHVEISIEDALTISGALAGAIYAAKVTQPEVQS